MRFVTNSILLLLGHALCLLHSSRALYSGQEDGVELIRGPTDFTEKILNKKGAAIVQFFDPSDEDCMAAKGEFLHAAEALEVMAIHSSVLSSSSSSLGPAPL